MFQYKIVACTETKDQSCIEKRSAQYLLMGHTLKKILKQHSEIRKIKILLFNLCLKIQFSLTHKQGRSMFSHDYVFWCGDFNYRIDLTYEEVFYFLKRQDWKTLLEFDQLQQQKSSGKVRELVLFERAFTVKEIFTRKLFSYLKQMPKA